MRVSVLMSVYNTDELFLKESIESILRQSFTDFEFLIYDDGSNNETKHILNYYEKKDRRIKIIINSTNKGLTENLRQGVLAAEGEYICRQDADDISLIDRIEKEVQYLDKHKDTVLVATNYYERINNKDCINKKRFIKNDNKYIKSRLVFENVIMHSSVMLRKSFLIENEINYDSKYKKAQDFNLWSKLLKVGEFAIVPDRLCILRFHNNRISIKNVEEQKKYYVNTVLLNLKQFNIVEDSRYNIGLCNFFIEKKQSFKQISYEYKLLRKGIKKCPFDLDKRILINFIKKKCMRNTVKLILKKY